MADVDPRRTFRALPRPGDIKLSFVPADHDGWLLLDGRQTLSRTAMPRLFGVLGTRYGAGDGVATFGLPKASDTFLMAAGAAHALGATGGAESHALTVEELPAHGHGYAKVSKVASPIKVASGGLLPLSLASDLQASDATTATTGSAKAIPLLPPFLAVNAFVYAGL